MIKKIAHFVIWKEDVIRVTDALAMFGTTELGLAKDKDSYMVNVIFDSKDYGRFLDTMFRLSGDRTEFRKPIVRTMIFGLEL